MRCCWQLILVLLVVVAPCRAADVSVEKSTDAIAFKVDGSVVGRYAIGLAVAKPYLWPLLAPGGVPVTRAWPMEKGTAGETTDHVHQKSAWFCHGDVIPEGIDLKIRSANKGDHGVDFWSETKDRDGTPRHGTIRCLKVGEPKQEAKDRVAIVTWNEWKTPDGIKILDEERTVGLQDLPAGRLWVFECTLTASVCPITFGDTKEGSFGIRVHDALRGQSPTGGTVTAADGTVVKAPSKDNLSVWGRLSDWHDYSGMVDGKAVGVAIFDHPKNTARAAWHTRAYGLMAANPFARDHSGFPGLKGKTELVKIEKGKSLTLRYAIYAHTGDAVSGKVAEAYATFAK
jgi:hypothetical protein